jgi:Cu/Ag efflux pump CusA
MPRVAPQRSGLHLFPTQSRFVVIFVLLFGAFQSVGDTLLIMLNLPFALIGGTLALFFWRANFNISAAVGYIAVFGRLEGVLLAFSGTVPPARRARQSPGPVV